MKRILLAAMISIVLGVLAEWALMILFNITNVLTGVGCIVSIVALCEILSPNKKEK